MQEIWPAADLIEATRAGIELWRPVPDTNGRYDASNMGRIRSRVAPGKRGPTILTPCPNRKDHPYLCVTLHTGERRRYVPVHNLVCEAFIGPRPGSPKEWEAGHHDDDKANNRLDNLKWCTKQANGADMKRNGRLPLRECREVEGVRHYRCTRCVTWKPETDFNRIRGKNALASACGVLPECRRCASARRSESRRRTAAA